jgi:hypothetical protein
LTRLERFKQYLEESNKKNDVVILEVEEFLKAYKANEEIITPYAKTMTLTVTKVEKGWLGRPRTVTYKSNFCDALGNAIAAYQGAKELNYMLKWEHAYKLLDLVQRGRVFGAIRNAKQQQQNYEQEILRLKEQIENLKKLNDKLIAENKILHGLADVKTNSKAKGKGDGEIGDVGF